MLVGCLATAGSEAVMVEWTVASRDIHLISTTLVVTGDAFPQVPV